MDRLLNLRGSAAAAVKCLILPSPAALAISMRLDSNASIYVQEVKGRIQNFKIEGAQKMSSAHHERKAQNPYYSGWVHIGPP